MIEIAELLRKVMIYAPNAPEPLAETFIRDAADEYLERSRAWKVVDTITVTDHRDGDLLQDMPDARIVEILDAFFDDGDGSRHHLTPVTIEHLNKMCPGWYVSPLKGCPKYMAQQTPGTIMIYPRRHGKLTVNAALGLAESAQTMPDFLLTKHSQKIARGAASKLLTMPGVEYANPQLGAALHAEFQSFLEEASSSGLATQVKGRTRTTSRFV